MQKALIFGKSGQVAWELLRSCPDGWQAHAYGRDDINLTDTSELANVVAELEPDLLINAAAYTAVDKAEAEPDQAYAVNQQAVANIADIAQQHNVPLIHISTDFVFDGAKSSPYTAEDATHPLGVYGASKLAGEREVLSRDLPNALILRTSWVYSSHGQNFVKTMLRLMGDPNRDQLSVVCDQIGSPTWAHSLAKAIWAAALQMTAQQSLRTTKVLNWTDAGVASWYDFAEAIQELALERNLLRAPLSICPIPHTAYPTPAQRPQYSVLDKSGFEEQFQLQARHWRKELACMMNEFAAQAECSNAKSENV